jgi:hypothetical protein
VIAKAADLAQVKASGVHCHRQSNVSDGTRDSQMLTHDDVSLLAVRCVFRSCKTSSAVQPPDDRPAGGACPVLRKNALICDVSAS